MFFLFKKSSLPHLDMRECVMEIREAERLHQLLSEPPSSSTTDASEDDDDGAENGLTREY